MALSFGLMHAQFIAFMSNLLLIFVIAKMDSSQHTVLTNLIILTAVNIYKKTFKKMLIQIKTLANHYHSWLIKLILSKIVISIIPNVAT